MRALCTGKRLRSTDSSAVPGSMFHVTLRHADTGLRSMLQKPKRVLCNAAYDVYGLGGFSQSESVHAASDGNCILPNHVLAEPDSCIVIVLSPETVQTDHMFCCATAACPCSDAVSVQHPSSSPVLLWTRVLGASGVHLASVRWPQL